MLLLCIDSSTPTVSVALGDGGTVLGRVELRSGRRHAEQIAPAIEYLCRETGVALSGLAAVGVGVGPGLFTGLRVGVTTAKAIAQTLRVPVVCVPSLDLLAYPLRHAATRLLVPVIDARRREVFYALYRPVQGGVQRVSDYEVGPPGDLAAELEARGEETMLAGEGALLHRSHFDVLERAEFAGLGFVSPSAAVLVELASAKVEREEFVAPAEVVPLYLRRSDAEIEWDRAASARERES